MRMRMLTNRRFGRLVAIRIAYKKPRIKWYCACDCGNMAIVDSKKLVDGWTKSCGCLWRESITTHGLSNIPEYTVWEGMRSRCLNPNSRSYPWYGGLGIRICERWNDFKNFYEDMGPRPSSKYTIERLNVDGNYEPRNCIWATWLRQAYNKRVRVAKL